MNEILTDLSTHALTRAVKANLYAYFQSFHESTLVETSNRAGTFRWRTPVAHPWFNGLLSNRLPTSFRTPRLIQETLEYFNNYEVHDFTWWLQPGLDTAPWAEILEPLGFQYTTETPGMAIEIANLPRVHPHPNQLIIRQVTNLETLAEWAQTFALGYPLPASIVSGFYDLLASLGLELPHRHYIAYLYGKAVGTASLFIGAGVAGLYNISTIPEARGMGIGAALTLTPAHHAQAMGLRAAVLQSSEMGFRVYQRLGFQTLSQMDHFYHTTNTP